MQQPPPRSIPSNHPQRPSPQCVLAVPIPGLGPQFQPPVVLSPIPRSPTIQPSPSSIALRPSAIVSQPVYGAVPFAFPSVPRVPPSAQMAIPVQYSPQYYSNAVPLNAQQLPARVVDSTSKATPSPEQLTTTTDKITLYVNNKEKVITGAEIKTTLNDYLRSLPGCTGVKRSCGEGGCGACTITADFEQNGVVSTLSFNSCLRPLASCDGMKITTVEGLNSRNEVNVISQRLADSNGSQCGFCSTGMVMSMYSLLKNNAQPTKQQVEDYFDGNLCRCTGYRPILDAMKSFAVDGQDPKLEKPYCADIEDLCAKNRPSCRKQCKQTNAILTLKDPSGASWYSPKTVPDLLSIINSAPSLTKKFVVGNTSIGIYKDQNPDMWIYIRDIQELQFVGSTDSGIVVGGAATITQFIEHLDLARRADSSMKTSYIPVLLRHFKLVANTPVRNVGSVSGNLMLVNQYAFASDIFAALLALNAGVKILHPDGKQTDMPLDVFQHYDMKNKIIHSITVPWAKQEGGFEVYKAMLRHVNSHAIINAAFYVELDSSTRVTKQPILVYTGVQNLPVRATQTEQLLVGRSWNDPSTLRNALVSLQQTLVPTITPGTKDIPYRISLILTFFYKFYLSQVPYSKIPPALQSAAKPFIRPVSSGTQSYGTDPSEYPVSKPLPKLDSKLQTGGEACYTDDLHTPSDSLFAAYVLSSIPVGDLVSIDASAALSAPGVVGWVSSEDILPENNSITIDPVPWEWHEPVFVDKKIVYNGQPIGLIVADSRIHAEQAAKLVKVTYDTSKAPKPILHLDDAITRKSFFPSYPGAAPVGPFKTGDLDKGFAESKHIIEDQLSLGSQYHFHMETQTSIAIPKEGQKMFLYSSTQWPSIVQNLVGRVLGINSSQVLVEVPRVGGAYGAKISRASMVATAAAVAAKKFNRPVRLVVDLNTNMQMVGKRHPFRCDYKVGFGDNGKVNALKMTFYEDGGCAYDTAPTNNCYYIPNFYVEGVLCQTNLPTNTYTRGPGCIAALYFLESILERVARSLSLPADIVKPLNFYQKGQVTPYGQPLPYFSLDNLWSQLKTSCDYDRRKAAVDAYNQSNKWTKKGISLVPIKYGIAYSGIRYGCTVSIFMDGTVSVAHSGIEIGQGINTKVAQCAAYALGVPLEIITVETTTSNTAPNCDSTGGSVTNGLNSKIVLEACDVLNKRLAPLRTLHRHTNRTEISWKDLITKAYQAGIELRATGWVFQQDPTPFTYNSYGVACTEAYVDILTGETQVLQSDILFDCGISLNPDVDIGQVEGAFMQGLGYYLTEVIEHDQTTGKLLTDGTWEYKPPSQVDIPIVFNVALLKDAPNPAGVLRSKAAGEPPYALAASVFFAVKNAVASSRAERGLSDDFELPAPATVMAIHLASGVYISDLLL